MQAIFFASLAVIQLLVGLIGSVIAYALSLKPSLRNHRARMMGAVRFGAFGAYLGVAVGFASVIAIGFLWNYLTSTEMNVSEQYAPTFLALLLPAGYVAGLLGGALFGWRRCSRRI